MTVRTRIGIDYAGVSCVKITKGDRDPAEILDTEYGAFYYNSKWAADLRVLFSERMVSLGLGSFTTFYQPSGSGASTYTWCADNYSSNANSFDQKNYYRNSNFPSLVYSLPLHEVKPIRKTNGRFVQNAMIVSYRGYEDRGTRRSPPNTAVYGWCQNYNNSLRAPVGTVNGIPEVLSSPSTPSGSDETFGSALAVWNLPGDETPIQNGTPLLPVPGQHTIIINKDSLKVAKPGFDARTATGTQLAFDSANRPAKVVAADDIALNAGVNEYSIGFTVPSTTLVDVHYYVGSDIYYPASPTDLDFGGEHWISGDKLYFNAGTACRARFIVYAFDNTPATAGNNDVFRQVEINGQSVMQLLRPGASENPSFADICLDSRWPCLQIIKEGFISVADGSQAYTITHNAGADVFPMVKYTTVHGATSASSITISKSVRQPRVALGRLTRAGSIPVPLFNCGDSTYCKLTNNDATFYTFRGAPTFALWRTSQDYTNNTITREYDPAPLYGIRYYILGLPKKD